MIKSVTRIDITKRVAKDLGLTIKQTREIVEASEEIILDFLKERGQVRLHNFGTFYQTTIKSHVIKQINTKTPRIVLEQKSLKFRPSPVLKDAIYGRIREKKVVDPEVKIKRAEKLNRGTIPIQYIPTKRKEEPEEKKKVISFGPIKIHPRVDKENIQEKIKERWLKVAKNHTDQPPKSSNSREVEIFARLLNQIYKTGNRSVDFAYGPLKEIPIYSGRPRHQVSHLPREIVKGFLSYLDIEEFHIPQERYRLIFVDETKYDKINIVVHSLPTQMGASIHIDIK